jgi:endogenous inhibitor of DNA gyrase (YacG/DUF329 family)
LSPRFCKNCAKPLASEPKRKPKTYCDDHCRGAWWRANRDRMLMKAVYQFNCTNCGHPFESYGSRDRKYCSRGCYIAYRYGVP